MTLQHGGNTAGTLADVIDKILDKGLIINADIKIAVVGVELLDIRIRAAVASFETAAMYGLEFPSGTKLPAWAGQIGVPEWAGQPAAPAIHTNGHVTIPQTAR